MTLPWRREKPRRHRRGTMKLILMLAVALGAGSSLVGSSNLASVKGAQVTSVTSARKNRELIVGGSTAIPEDYPFFALTASDEYATTSDNMCGASLIHPDILISAAHCQGFFNYGVRLYSPESGRFNRRTRIVEQWRHPNFNLNNDDLNWDVLIMRLEEPIYDISPVPLNSDSNVPERNEVLKAVGYGATEFEGEMMSNLMKGEFQYMTPNTCLDRINTFMVTGAEFGDELLCVGPTDSSNSICLGDSGGPLLTQDVVLVGITSWTVNCRADQIPDGFTRISTVYSWIQEKICEISVDKPSSCPSSLPNRPNTMVEMKLRFRYDFSPEDTTFAVRNQQTGSIEYAGPTYVVPDRVETSFWDSTFFLPEGRYIFEVYDKGNDGLSDTEMNAMLGAWDLYARYQQGNEDFTLVASGNNVFFQESTTAFQIDSAPTISPQPTPAPTSDPTGSPTKFPTRSPTGNPTFLPTVSPQPTAAPTGSPTAGPTFAPTIPPTIQPSPSPTSRPTPGPTMMPTVTPSPTIITPEPTEYPSMNPTTAPSPSPTISPAPTMNETMAPSETVFWPTGTSTGAFEMAATLLFGLFFLQIVVLVRAGCFLDNPQRWMALARAFSVTPWPSVDNMAIFASALNQISGWRQQVALHGRELPRWLHSFSESTVTSDSFTTAMSNRLVVRFTEMRSRLHAWYLDSCDHVIGSSYEYPFAAARTYLCCWYQETFQDPADTDTSRDSDGTYLWRVSVESNLVFEE